MTKEDAKMTAAKTARVQRKSLFQRGPQAINGGKDPEYQYRFVNDTGSRIENFKGAGYELVTDAELTVGDSRVSDPTGLGSTKVVTSNDGGKAYLMRIKKDWYDEDQAAKLEYVNEQEASMTQKASQEMSYGNINITRK